MALYTVIFGQQSNPTDLNQVVNVLQQPSGGQEKGKYWLEGNFYASGAYCSTYIPSLSRGTTPVSVSIDTTDQAPSTHLNAPSTDHLTSSGFHIYSTSTAISGNEFCGGNYTIQY